MLDFTQLAKNEERLTDKEFEIAKERIRQLGACIAKENKRREEPDTDSEGWFSVKINDETQEETIKNMFPPLYRNDLNLLIKAGWLEESFNPLLNWDSVKQYRINLDKMFTDMEEFCLYLAIAYIIS